MWQKLLVRKFMTVEAYIDIAFISDEAFNFIIVDITATALLNILDCTVSWM